MSMNMSEEDQKILDSSQQMNMGDPEAGVAEGQAFNASKQQEEFAGGLPDYMKGADSELRTNGSEKPKQTPEDFWAGQKKQLDKVRENNNPYGENQTSPTGTHNPDSDVNKSANDKYKEGVI